MKEYDNNLNMQAIDNIVATLSVPYKDTSVLTTSSKERDIVDYYFKSVSCNDEGIERLLYEIIGYSLIKSTKLQRAFIFKGEGRNGKSVIYRLLEVLLGEKQCSHEHLEQLSGSKLGSKSTIKALMGCTVNIAEDQEQPRYVNTSLLTRIISGEPISIEQKREGKIEFKPYATMLYSVNDIIDFKAVGLHITDRHVVIPFQAKFTDYDNNRNINIVEELCKPLALQIIATRAIEAIKEALNRGEFTIPPLVAEETKRYFLDCNSVEEFCNLFPIGTIITKSRYYEEYSKWCDDNNKEAVSNSIFGKRVGKLGYRRERYSFGSNRHTYYTAPNFKNSDSRKIYDDFLTKSGVSEESDKTFDEDTMRKRFQTSFSDYLCECLYNKNDNAVSE